MLKLIHGADLHLDSPFSGLSPQKAAQRRAELRQLPERLARLAVEVGADLVLLSGDLFDSDRVYRETAQALCTALGRLPCPVFIAPGNHDFYGPASPYATLSWPDNVHIFSTNTLEDVEISGLNCTVWGRAFTEPHQSSSPLAGFSAPQDGRLHLMCLHGEVTQGDSDYGPISREDIAASGLAYLALGHIHAHSGFRTEGRTVWAYPGCPEGRGFDELGEKGVIYAELENGCLTAGEFIPLCRRRYADLTVDITQKDPREAILAAVPADSGEDIFRITLRGQGEVPDLSALEEGLRPRFYGLTLRDRTTVPTDLWVRKEEDSLTGLFLRKLWELNEQAPDHPILQQAVRFGLAALEHGEDPYL